MNFADYFTFDNFKAVFDANNAPGEIDNKWREVYHKSVKDNFEDNLIKFLKDYHENIGLSKINLSEGHRTNFQHEWNRIINKDHDDYGFRSISNMFRKAFSYDMHGIKDESNIEEIKKLYNTVIDRFNTGTFEEFHLSDSHECFECGQALSTSFNKWKPEYFIAKTETFTNAEGKLKYRFTEIPPEPCLNQNTLELKVNFPTGELLMADWFRIPEFTKIVSRKDFSINNSKGQVESTQYHLENFNVVTVHLGNNSPEIMFDKKAGTFIFGQRDEEYGIPKDYDYNKDEGYEFPKDPKDRYKSIGNICTDLWNATIVDKADLIKILAQQIGDKAEDTVNEYIKENKGSYGLNVIKVEPGNYTLKINPHYHNFKKYTKDEFFPEDVTPYFMLKRDELKLTKKIKIK